MELYIGIDFGTTNSVVAIGRKDALTERIIPQAHHVQMRGVPYPKAIIPSAAVYRKGEQKCLGIGEEAIEILKNPNPRNEDLVVVKSVKLQLGNKYVEGADWLTPEKVASDIIRFLKKSCEKKYNLGDVKNVVIGIPANFPPDKCEKTVVAGKMAGFEKVDLIPEPKAALLDYINTESRFSNEGRIINFSEPKKVLIFDIGGGTLDVNLAEVCQKMATSKSGKPIPEIMYKELGLSRYSTVGGDLFDRCLTDFLIRKFSEQNDGVDLNSMTNPFKKSKSINMLKTFAEAAKTQLTGEVNSLMDFGDMDVMTAMNEASYRILISNLLQSSQGSILPFNYKLSYLEYAEVIQPLLGLDLTLEECKDPKTFYSLVRQDSNNIIIPIFDALHQACDKDGVFPSIDLVLINGGMGRLNIIKERLKILFGTEKVFEITSPDLSVAQGAVINHYNRSHNLDKSRSILAESIYLLGAGNKYFPLIEAGTEYPTVTPIIHSRMFTFPSNKIPYINLPLYRGKNGEKFPIIERVVNLSDKSTSIEEGDELDIQIQINSNRALKFEAWLHEKPHVKFEVNVNI